VKLLEAQVPLEEAQGWRAQKECPREEKILANVEDLTHPPGESMTVKKEIVVLSPHLDDAVFDCCDHIFAWKRREFPVRVVTAFTAFSNRVLSQWARWYTGLSHCGSLAEFERERVCQDVNAMNALSVSWNHLGFVDAAFRSHEGRPIYPDSQSIFAGAVSFHDLALLAKLKLAIEPLKNRSRFAVPLGMGKHVDHIIVREAAEELILPAEMLYYLEYPYALHAPNWSATHVAEVIAAKKSIRWMSQAKRRLLRIYSSQYPVVFSRALLPLISRAFIHSYPEIILCPQEHPDPTIP
jgi:LmbE family N-acetylglucosaminyl deacetylase